MKKIILTIVLLACGLAHAVTCPTFAAGDLNYISKLNTLASGCTYVTPAAGVFTTISTTGQITSTLATGSAPFIVASTTQVLNLNASQLVGATWAAPAAIGSSTPAAGTFSALRNTGLSTGLVLGSSASNMTTYGGAACTNQFVRGLNASGAPTCATVGSSDLAASLSLTTPNIGVASATSLSTTSGSISTTSGNIATTSGDFTKGGGVISAAGVPIALPNAKYPAIVGSCLGTGNNDLYTVPASRKAVIFPQSRAYNPSAGNITYYHQIKVSGVYYPLSTPVTLTTGTGNSGATHNLPIVLNAGESLSLNTTTTACLNIRFNGVEYDDTEARLATSRILSLSSGNNTLMTVPALKSAYALANSLALAATTATGVAVANFSGGSLNYYINQVQSGGSVSTSNQMLPATAVGNQTSASLPGLGTMAAGDFVNVNASGASGVAFITYYLLP